ncbi:MAG: purine-nucleoside phosphorylase, partial [Bacteroidetes bacterium]|nr:purine-nucleoside phosphorylase [Bacteroidota bacterium]
METNIPNPETQLKRVEEAVATIRKISPLNPTVGLILGTGLGRLGENIDVHHRISYESLPHFPVSTVESHGGELLIGTLQDVPVVCMK